MKLYYLLLPLTLQWLNQAMLKIQSILPSMDFSIKNYYNFANVYIVDNYFKYEFTIFKTACIFRVEFQYLKN